MRCRLLFPLALCLTLLLGAVASADEKEEAKKLLLGKWHMIKKTGEREQRGELEFTADGKVSMSLKGEKSSFAFKGKYFWVESPNLLQIRFTEPAEVIEEVKVKVTAESLELTYKSGKTEKMTRIK